MKVFESYFNEMMENANLCKFWAMKYIAETIAMNGSIDVSKYDVILDNGIENVYIKKVYYNDERKLFIQDEHGIPYEMDSAYFSVNELYQLAEAIQLAFAFKNV